MYGSQTPIDIHCSKLVDWLVQHRHCKKDWGENLGTIRRKIRSALNDMPEHEEIKQLLIGTKLDYYKSKRIVEILRTTEASSKNFLGYYSSQRMKDWQDVVYSYERDYIYIAEIATDLIRETNYEVPGIRKVIARLHKDKEESEKERLSQLKKAKQFDSEYRKLAQSYGIQGNDVGMEFEEKSKSLSSVMEEIVELSKNLKSPIDYYLEFASATTKLSANKFLPMLQYITGKGNTTVFEWKYGEAPERIKVIESATSTNPSEIEIVDDEIDFGEDLPSSESSSGFVHVDKGDNCNIEESFIKVEASNPNIPSEASGDKVACGDEARLVLEYRKSRNQFINNLYELRAFFDQLHSDLAGSQDKSNYFASDNSSRVRVYEEIEITGIIKDIGQIINVINRDENRILFQMIDSPTFLESVKEKFTAKKKQASDCTVKAEYLSDHMKDLENQIKEVEVQLKKSIVAAKELQQKVISSLEELYKGRSINIMGCVS